MDPKMSFSIFKNIIIAQNQILLAEISKETGIDEDYLKEKYLKPDYYLPIIKKTLPKK